MKGLESYNRVKNLAAGKDNWLLDAGFWAVAWAVVVIAFASDFFWGNSDYYLLAGAAFALAALQMFYQRYLSRHCRYCGGLLQRINRPFAMKVEHLSSQGLKGDNCFYIEKPVGLLRRKHWVKYHNQSFACHNCRIHEEGYRQFCETVDSALSAKLTEQHRQRYHS
jgi:hypothetical protein